MAIIVIPSKNIYNKQNPKVRDNIIERIEVGAIEVLPNNEYNITVYNEEVGVEELEEKENSPKEQYALRSRADSESLEWYFAYVYLNNIVKYKKGKITIPKIAKNKYINYIYSKETDKESGINYSISGVVKKGNLSQTISCVGYTISSKSDFTIDKEETNKISSFKFPELPKKSIVSNWAEAIVESLSNETSISLTEDNNNYYLTYNILVYLKIEELQGKNNDFISSSLSAPDITFTAEGTFEEYIPESLTISINGDTIGIDLTDKTIYIPETDTTSKKVHSIDGNELMQTTNYRNDEVSNYGGLYVSITNPTSNRSWVYVGVNLNEPLDFDTVIEGKVHYETSSVGNIKPFKLNIKAGSTSGTLKVAEISGIVVGWSILESFIKVPMSAIYSEVKKQYANGKETATIRCSIADYYAYAANKPNYQGDKAITIEPTTKLKKMCFTVGDIVVPMVYGADGKDKPMSIKGNGEAKQFVVLGCKLFYDGAVWQELYLQEY